MTLKQHNENLKQKSLQRANSIDVAELRKLYVEDKLSIRQLLLIYKIGQGLLRKVMTDNNIPIRLQGNPNYKFGSAMDSIEVQKLKMRHRLNKYEESIY
ncbi:MAG: hypothetical protein IPM96_21955 [Ignavibacteria bacterium]|nr:hypothetical protein [Ignavibacteria bacterium]